MYVCRHVCTAKLAKPLCSSLYIKSLKTMTHSLEQARSQASQKSPACVKLITLFAYLGNRARYKFIKLDMSTGLDLSILSSRPLTFPGGQSKNGYRA